MRHQNPLCLNSWILWMTRLSSAILLKSNLKTGQMIAAHRKRQPDLLRNPLRAQAGALGVISWYWEKGMNNSLGLDSQNLPLLVNFTSEILDLFKPKPQLSRCKFIKAPSLHDSLLTETTILLQSSSCGKRSKRINIYSSLNKAAFPPTSEGRTIKGFSRTIRGKSPACQSQPLPAQWNLGH